MIYIHYGASKYDPNKFNPIRSNPVLLKPDGGLWASPIGAKLGWKDWYEGNDFRVERLEDSFQFTLSSNANIINLYSADQLHNLPKAKQEFMPILNSWVYLDFEKLKDDGVDAVQVNISDDITEERKEGLYWKLYGWDCDSILVLNKEVIIP